MRYLILKGKSIVFGNNPHHPGSQTAANPPRVRDIEVTYIRVARSSPRAT